MAGKPKPIKVCLTNKGEDTETPWAHDLGPAPGPPGSRKVRLINVPFMHAKPTWGDTIVVSPVEAGFPTWDRDGIAWSAIGSRIEQDGGRWAMIIDYAPHPDAADAFGALAYACAEHDIVCEGAWGPRGKEPGRAYLAVKNELTDSAVMMRLRDAHLPCELIQIHPAPTKEQAPSELVAEKPTAKQTAADQPATDQRASKKPTSKKPTSKQPASKQPASKKPASQAPASKKPASKKPASKEPASKEPASKKSASKRTPPTTKGAPAPARRSPRNAASGSLRAKRR